MSKVGIFGGTFDPIHMGHLITAQSVREIRKLDKIIFIPAYISPHKTSAETSSTEHRSNMIKIAIEDVPFFECSDIEIKKGGISYTVDTLRELKKIYDEIEFIIGYDNIFSFNKWKDPDDILKLAKILVLKRKSSLPPPFEDKYYHQAVFVQTRGIELSATDIRERVNHNQPIHFLVPQKVKEYINEHNLYRN
ncbi:MAG: nicotinate-nucleotide adenylyltransferase [Ignavibacteria bacterium]|nr:nicotinate-nucleotide adenylyltransferase [Ignavibacteria bacterium]MBT8383064.1 nicotinate-nucleotide adenylyltransferase [Ignavibacteria bacterium]MBT8392397.1 nicotinate-nucleotide adenylyltransferase [Ignavibacteria bacterium]NNJ52658.1 nicotinate-nucleotide adenylyltransferase [Ignavibacteriaceae bacterium]NNL22179.1 nicotinate-nucleotide adenylyltransferase [Ignavibacteriaceae bacterium]